MTQQLTTVHSLMTAIESGETGESLRKYFHPQAEQVEYPSAVDPSVGVRGLDAMLLASEKGADLLTSQRYEVLNTIEQGDQLMLQVEWFATLAVAFGAHPPGTTLHTFSALVFTFREGLIVRMEAYDCYDPIGA